MQRIAQMIEENRLGQIQKLKELEDQARGAKDDVAKQIALEKLKQEAKDQESVAQRQISERLTNQIAAQEAFNRQLLHSIKANQAKIIEDSKKDFRSFLDKQKEQMREWMKNNSASTNVYGGATSGSRLVKMVQEERENIAQRYQMPSGNFITPTENVANQEVNFFNAGFLN